ncbi:MAG: AI-2E family transporter [Actinobacteria bacterium]|jgi:predicted PurR-regulated permease PerM|nr:AI-2E family transporter [Actinomycetota bacterium]NCW42531.1 AI-2E family transporter [Actinomycetota bacterium]NCW91949.1 AI-2E family transporter [Actinomycetota bacterium]NCX36990.1 AI-2E family transporter [Actinomycetota bacterium]NCX39204.1 AI-2E family transporter [Actinomycetota bacterium]
MAIKERIKKVTKRAAKPAQTPTDFGVAGVPINRSHPYYFGFVATLGALTAIVLMRALASVSQIFILILIALFLATGLNPAVEALRRRNMSRVTAVTIIFTSVIAFVIFFALVVAPPVITQGTQLINKAPTLLADLTNNSTINKLNDQYGIIDTLQSKLTSVTSDGTLLISAFGGVIGVGKSVLSGFFTFLTILVLTLYFITSLPQAVNLGLSLVPASRRTRIGHLTNAIIARVGSFVGSQIVIAAMASVFVFALSLVLGLPSPIAIGMIVFVCGLIPLVGHFLGSGIVTIIALTQSIAIGIIAFVAYVVYVQIENYVVTPRIMKRTLAVPGAVTIISALIGSSLLGLVGGLLAVPVAASIILILDEVVIPRANNS